MSVASAEVAQVAPAVARVVPGLVAPSRLHAACGPALPGECEPDDNLGVHRLLQRARPGDVLVVRTNADGAAAYVGELIALDAAARGVSGIVLDGPARDTAELAAGALAVFHAGTAPAPCVKRALRSVGEAVEIGGVLVEPGDQVVADADAVVVVPRAAWPEVEAAAAQLRAREDAIRAALARGARLADLVDLPREGL